MDVKEYIEKHNINVPLEAVEEFQRDFLSVIDKFQDKVFVIEQTYHEISAPLDLLLKQFRDKYEMNPVVEDNVLKITGVVNRFSAARQKSGAISINPIFDRTYPVEHISVSAATFVSQILGKPSTDIVTEDQAPVLAAQVAELELQAKFESYSKKQWVTIDYGFPARFLCVLKNSEQPFLLVCSRKDGTEAAFSLREDLREFDYDDHPAIKENSPYADWPMDAKVRYWDGAYERHAHYAGTDENGNATVWRSWGTSWTTQERFCPEFVELAED